MIIEAFEADKLTKIEKDLEEVRLRSYDIGVVHWGCPYPNMIMTKYCTKCQLLKHDPAWWSTAWVFITAVACATADRSRVLSCSPWMICSNEAGCPCFGLFGVRSQLPQQPLSWANV